MLSLSNIFQLISMVCGIKLVFISKTKYAIENFIPHISIFYRIFKNLISFLGNFRFRNNIYRCTGDVTRASVYSLALIVHKTG